MNFIIAAALRQRVLVVLLLAAMLAAGGFAFANLNIEAYPDPVPPSVEIVTQNSGISAEEIERNITIPIEVAMAGIPHVKTIRTISLFGLSDVKVQFTYDYTFEQAQQQVINRLGQVDGLPDGVSPGISPVSPIGEIYRYRVVGPPGYSVMDLKTIQDWVVERRIKAVPGVIDVTGWGGKTRTYDVVIDNDRLVAEGVTVANVIDALNKSNANVGGQTVTIGPQSAIVRGVALIHSVDEVNRVLVGMNGSQPVRLRDVATVKIGNQPRLGIAGQNDDSDIVQGTVLMYRGAQSSPTIAAVEAAIHDINTSGVLPPGVKLERIYDRSGLIKLTTHTVIHNMIEGIVLIFVLQWLFLGNLRSAVIVAATIPFALSVAMLIITVSGESANLLSVGALDFGLIVDATVIMVENIFRHLVERSHAVEHGEGAYTWRSRMGAILRGSGEVNRGIFFAAAIIIASFIPLFTLTGIEGHIFGPMAKTYAYAIAGGLIATFTVSPVLSALLLPDRLDEVETWIIRKIRAVYEPSVRFALANRVLTLGAVIVLVLGTGLATRTLGIEFLPKLEEGNMWIRATMPASVSLEDGQKVVNEARRIIASYPEVETVVSQHGRPDDGTDATGFFNAEFFAPLKPFDTWPRGMTKAKLTEEMEHRFAERFPGVEFSFSQYIEDNVEEAASGVKGANSIKLYGPDLATLEATGKKIEDAMAKVPGITDLGVFQLLGQPTVQVAVDRDRAARYGLTPEDVNQVVRASIGGQDAGELYEHGTDRHFPIVVRLQPSQRQSIESIGRITVGAPGADGATIPVPLSEVADIRLISGPSFVYREHQERYIPIKFAVRGRDLGSAVAEAQKRVAHDVKLPPGYHLEWAGELGNLQDAIDRLELVVPISLALILVLLFLNFGSARDMLLSASVMPMALVGGVLALILTGTTFSISAAIGFVALLGISVMDGIIVLTAFNQAIDHGLERAEALVKACENSLRPVLMTCLVAAIGLVPAAFSSGIGSQVQKPLAIVVVGGMLLAPILILLALPVLIDMFSRHTPPGADPDGEPEEEALA
ncbi:efflux RND transporter permease subunit [Sphingomonas sp. AP4-R1]|uniref:efflux RND transporter permease subunit n=1 Tax=Sphingomonas sp. AP4-R1 TaxID=2735134 RepID=UPI001493602E|nr:CusA/CzcA family heavy metal efflux RND transporter [Sphingomonas sp. AP4-R1]QJU59091.1 efflux RND transporter permease subunit [Sphingomonas sp. AP4-R1]